MMQRNKQYIMFDLVSTQGGIFYFENVISYEKEMLDLLNEIDSDERSHVRIPKWDTWTASNDVNTVYGKRKEIRTDSVKNSTGDEMLDMHTLYIINSLKMAPEMCALYYANAVGMDKSEINLDLTNISVRMYDSGQGMGPHIDGYDPNGTGTNLRFSMVTYLNDDYEGGEIYFKNQNVTIKPKASSLVMFPSQEPYLHESKPVISGNKYMYTTHWMV